MHDIFPVLRVLGMLMVLFALSMLVPLSVSWVQNDGVWQVWPAAMLINMVLGLGLWWSMRRHTKELQARHGVILVTLVWGCLPLCAALPMMGVFYVQGGAPLPFTYAYFEAVSGLTTSGATVLTGLDQLPVSLNIWRTFLQWLGGMGILILAVAIMPLLGVGGSQLFRAEAAGPVKDTKLTPRITSTAKGLWGCTRFSQSAVALRSGWRACHRLMP